MALRLHWPDERYVRIYIRDTLDWSALSWNAQALWVQLNRKADRRGHIALGRVGRRGVGALLGRADLWPDPLERALADLEADGCVRVCGDVLVIVDFVEAQEAVSSGRARQRKYRDAKRAGDETSPASDEASPKVTPGYSTARKVRHSTARSGAATPARGTRQRAKAGVEPDPRHRPLQERLEAAFREVRGVTYGFRGGRDAKAVAELLRLSGGDVAEVEARWRRGLELGERWPGCATFGQLAHKWNDLAVHARRKRAEPVALPGAGCPEWAAVLAEHDRLPPEEQRPGIRDLNVVAEAGALVLRATDEGDAERLRDLWVAGIEKLAARAAVSKPVRVAFGARLPARAAGAGGAAA